MSYGSNWFKGCRDILNEAIEENNPHDFFILCLILNRVRFNGNRGQLELGEANIGLREIGKLARCTREEVEGSLKRLDKKGVTKTLAIPKKGTSIKVLLPQLYSSSPPKIHPSQTLPTRSNIDKIRKEKNTNTVSGAPLVDKFTTLNKWEDIKEDVFARMRTKHGYNDAFMEDRWEELLVYDEGKPYKNRKSGAVNWFNSHITKEKWERAKPAKTMREILIEAGCEL